MDNKELIRLKEIIKELDELIPFKDSGMVPLNSITFFHSKIKQLDETLTEFEVEGVIEDVLGGTLSELKDLKNTLIKSYLKNLSPK